MILDLQKKLKEKKISSVELTKIFLKRIHEDDTNSFITLNEEEALKTAQQADGEREKNGGSSSPLFGIPIAVKDVLCTKGLRTTCGSRILENYVPPYDATVVERLKKNKMPILGKLNMDEFAMGSSNENSAFGPVRNPCNLDHVPGGSSGGSAAAVRAALAPLSLGTDTGGSVRLPAAYTGVVGLKPTYGRVSRFGLVAYASSLDQVGPMSVTVQDSAALLQAIAGHDILDATSSQKPVADYARDAGNYKQKKFKIGLPKEYFVGGLQSEVQSMLEEVKRQLAKSGHEFIEVSLPHTDYAVAVYYIVAVSEASSNLSRFDGVRFGKRVPANSLVEMYERTRALFGEEVKRRILLGSFALSAGYYDAYYKKACQVRRLIQQDFQKAFEAVDVILSPVSPTTAFRLGEKNQDPLQMYLNDIFTIPVNLAGLPALSVPVGKDAQGLPIGLQWIGKPFQESQILQAGQWIEKEFYFEMPKGFDV